MGGGEWEREGGGEQERGEWPKGERARGDWVGEGVG